MPNTKPLTVDDLASAVVAIVVALAAFIVFVVLMAEYRIARTIDSVERIEQKVNQCQP